MINSSIFTHARRSRIVPTDTATTVDAPANVLQWVLSAVIAGLTLGDGLAGLTVFMSNDSLLLAGYLEIFILLTLLYTLGFLVFACACFIFERLTRIAVRPTWLVSLAFILLSLVYCWNYWLFHSFFRSEQRIVLLLEIVVFLGLAFLFLISGRIRQNSIMPLGRYSFALLLVIITGIACLNGTIPSIQKQSIPADAAHGDSQLLTTATAHGDSQLLATQLILFGLDGADWHILHPLIKTGKLPFLTRMVGEGWCGSLETFNPTSSPLIWTSIVTGKHPFQHGIRDFGIQSLTFSQQWISVLPKGAGLLKIAAIAGKAGLWHFHPSTSDMVRSRTLWQICSEQGISTLVGNWPVCVPVEPVNGIIVGEIEFFAYHGLEANRVFYPEPMSVLFKRVQLERGLFHYQHNVSDIGPDLELVTRIERETLDQWQRFHYAWSKWRPQLTMLYTHSLDMTQHIFWRFGMHNRGNVLEPRYREAYRRIEEHIINLDRQMGLFFETGLAEPVIMIVSDHGFRSLFPFEKLINRQAKRIQGVHDYAPPGTIIVNGPCINPQAGPVQATVFSITPTILSLLGLPQARDMFGRSIFDQIRRYDGDQPTITPEMIDSYDRPDAGTSRKPPHAVSTQAGDDIQQKLKNLGYLE